MKKLSAIILFVVVIFAAGFLARSYGIGPGMMGGGMMSRTADSQTSPIAADPQNADALLAYIRSNNLPCSQCHSVSNGGFGPSFAAISASYSDRSDAVATLEDHIANGFRRMPGGLASNSQSEHLARMILGLAKNR